MILLNKIVKKYGETIALDHVDLEIKKGDLVTLIGPSGCGKSTLLGMINRMIEPTSGEIHINAVNALQLDPVKLRRSIGYVIQNAGLFPHLTVVQNIEIVTSILGWEKHKKHARSQELLKIVGLEPTKFAHRYPRELSGGQQQRVGIARALAADPEVLLMDEPFSAVDPLTREQLQAELLRIQSEVSKTIVFVTHDIQEAILLGDKVALMREGRVVQYNTPAELLKNPIDDFTAQFLGQERELQYLGLSQVQDIIRHKDFSAEIFELNAVSSNFISAKSNARNALSKLLGGTESLIVVDDAQKPIGKVTLQDFS